MFEAVKSGLSVYPDLSEYVGEEYPDEAEYERMLYQQLPKLLRDHITEMAARSANTHRQQFSRWRKHHPRLCVDQEDINRITDHCNDEHYRELLEAIELACQTACERQIVDLRIQGFNDSEIAQRLGLHDSTINRIRHKKIEPRVEKSLDDGEPSGSK